MVKYIFYYCKREALLAFAQIVRIGSDDFTSVPDDL